MKTLQDTITKWRGKAWAVMTMVILSTLTATASSIEFTDTVTKRICLENFDSNCDGSLTIDEAERVSSLRGKFRKSDITSFDELKYFTNLWYIGFRPNEGIQDYNAMNECGDFYNCKRLKSITIPENVTFIGKNAFCGCSSLKSIEIPSKVSEIGDLAFHGCKSLRIVSVKATTPPVISAYTFTNRENTVLIVPKGCMTAYKNADYWKDFMFITEDPMGMNTAYIAFTDNGTQATFFFDNNKKMRQGKTLDLDSFDGLDSVTAAGVKKVVFDISFTLAKPTSIRKWFQGMANLSAIEGLRYLDTSEVTDMSKTFYGCSRLDRIDVSGFDTSNTTNMQSMFHDCSGLKCLDLSLFDTSKATNTEKLLYNCTSLDSLAVSITMSNLHDNALTGVGTEDKPCAIYYPENFNFGIGDTNGCFPWKSGWFWIDESCYEAYIVLAEDCTNITYYYDNWINNREGYAYKLEGFDYYSISELIGDWLDEKVSLVKSVSFKPSFAKARLTKTAGLFKYMQNLEAIEGMEFLNTSEVTNMAYMFNGCTSLKNVDLSHFDTSKVIYSSYMFSGCTNLRNLTISDTMGNLKDDTFNDVGAKDSPCLITAPEGFNFTVNTSGSSFQWKGGWFRLANADAKSYIIISEDGTQALFSYDNKKSERSGTVFDLNGYQGLDKDLATSVTKVVFDPSFSLARPTSTCKWFYEMNKLSSIEGIEFLNTSMVTNMKDMFSGCNSLTYLDLSLFNTSKVTTMQNLFFDCRSLSSLNVSHFDTSSLILDNMNGGDSIFADCTGLGKLSVSPTMANLGESACHGVGTKANPCLITAPEDFDYGYDVETNKPFLWKNGWFAVPGFTPIEPNDTRLYADAVELTMGNTGSISLNLDNDAPVIMAEFWLLLPDGVAMATDEEGHLEASLNTNRSDNHTLEVNQSSNGLYHFLMFHSNNKAIKGNSGEIIQFSIACNKGMEAGTYQGIIKDILLNDNNMEEINLMDCSFDIIVNDVQMGDVNGDRKINGSDIVEMVDGIMGHPSDKFVEKAADLNSDGKVNGSDLTQEIALVMAQEVSPAPAVDATLRESLTIMDNNDGTMTVSVDEGNGFILAQMVIELSPNQKLEEITTDKRHLVACRRLSGNRYLVICYSNSNAAFFSNKDIITIHYSGEGETSITNVMMVDEDRAENHLNNANTGNTTDLTAASKDKTQTYDIHTLDGVLVRRQASSLEGLQKGIYIVNGKKIAIR